ncbi:MAG: hypothetical protein ACF8CQ_22790 [Rhodopirellula sp. JB044]|uniref:hypothetical protein n=1 Tax=Rhodopirellula sp. JB044 TaxID=3342844 RepID=UPI00370A55A7
MTLSWPIAGRVSLEEDRQPISTTHTAISTPTPAGVLFGVSDRDRFCDEVMSMPAIEVRNSASTTSPAVRGMR